jgi:hypothetical protein
MQFAGGGGGRIAVQRAIVSCEGQAGEDRSRSVHGRCAAPESSAR